ncbi:MAG: PilZ domain-containing protein [Pseudomonadota bacterium]
MNDAPTLLVELNVPFQWRADVLVTEGSVAIRRLQTAMALGEKPPVVSDEAAGLELEVARLHQKTQLLIELLALALQGQSGRPSVQAVALSAEACHWQADSALAIGSRGSVELWLHAAAPEPLLWPAEISHCRAEGSGHALHATLLPLGEAAQAALDRHVFLLHRRAIAEAKAQRS